MNCGTCLHYLREKNKCPGCYTGKKIGGRTIKCGIRLCKQRRGQYCFECDDFPCDRLKRLDKRYQDRYGMSEISNLKVIKEKGIESFLANGEKKWIDGNCVLCVHDKKYYKRAPLERP